jgi:hypothetical protein
MKRCVTAVTPKKFTGEASTTPWAASMRSRISPISSCWTQAPLRGPASWVHLRQFRQNSRGWSMRRIVSVSAPFSAAACKTASTARSMMPPLR